MSRTVLCRAYRDPSYRPLNVPISFTNSTPHLQQATTNLCRLNQPLTMGYVDATLVLTKKNVLLSLRDLAPFLVTLSSAFFSMLILYFSQISINNGEGFDPSALDTPNPSAKSLSFIPRCVPLEYSDCLTLAYVPDNNTDVDAWVAEVARRNNIPLSTEVKAFPNGTALNRHLVANPNRTQAAYIFDADSLDQINGGNISYIVQHNDTDQADFPLGKTDFHTTVVLPNMIHFMNLVIMQNKFNMDVQISLKTSVFPHPNIVDDNGLDAFGQYGSLLTFATYFLILIFFLYKIVLEKERGLRDAMKLAGQYQSQHYISWCIPYVVFIFIQTLLLIAFGHAFRFKYFTVNSFVVPFLTMFIFGLSLIGWTMLIATLTTKSQSVSIVGFNLFIFGYIIASAGSMVYTLDPETGSPTVGDGAIPLRTVFAIAPSTMFVKALQDGTKLALQGISVTFETAGTYSTVFPIKDCWLYMFLSGLVAFLLSVYLDNVLISVHGAPLSPFYLFKASYWGFRKRKSISTFEKDPTDDDTSGSEDRFRDHTDVQSYDAEMEDADVRAEREAVASGTRDSAALVIKNISRHFQSLKAVDDVSFSVKQNTAFALLGHNGAGKSTLFNMLITALSPTKGDAFVYGLSVREDQDAVRKLLGVCPQFDIFWDMLTGAEHIEVFAALKGLGKAERAREAQERLSDVRLTEKARIWAGTYSGGMQRRLSVAIAFTGDPKIVLLDECTSGADPLVRRDLWGSIERAKKGRVVFLITHSIAEAQHLAGHDGIGIMAKGKLRVLGKALHLKSKFGAGYRLTAILRNEEDGIRLAEALDAVCSGTRLVGTSEGENGEIIADYGLPRFAKESEVLEGVQILEEKKTEFGVVDYSLNSTTLGEVFKKITSLSEDVHEDENEKKKRCCCL